MMKRLFENWRRHLKEGDVISIGQFPKTKGIPSSETDKPVRRGDWSGTPSPGDPELIDFVNKLEDVIGKKLEDVHGQSPIDIPIEKLEQLDNVMKELDELFDIKDTPPEEI